MKHEIIVVGQLQCNCSVLSCEKTNEAIIIDPGDEAAKIVKYVQSQNLKVKYVVHTHAHFDHFVGTAGVKTATNATLCLHKDDQMLYQNLPMQGRMFGMHFDPAPPIEKFIENEEVLSFGECKIEVLHTPGHSPGSICLKCKFDGGEKLFSGDTLFRESVGRSDLWGGDHEQLISSIKKRILTLEEELPVYPGHGPKTSILHEKKNNPFF